MVWVAVVSTSLKENCNINETITCELNWDDEEKEELAKELTFDEGVIDRPFF